MSDGIPDQNLTPAAYQNLDRDAENVEHELRPEKQALNFAHVKDFLIREKGIAKPGDLGDKFKLDTAIALAASQKDSKGAQQLLADLNKAKRFLSDRGMPADLLDSTNDTVVKSNIHRELEKRDQLAQEKELVDGYYVFRMVKLYCERVLSMQEQFQRNRDSAKTKTGKTMEEQLKETIGGIKENFGNMDGKEKALVAVGGIIAAAMLMTSSSERVGEAREMVWTCMKIGGVGLLANSLMKVFTGKSAFQTISDYSSREIATDAFWMKTYKTSAENAQMLHKSTIYLGDKDFKFLAQQYKDARDRGAKTIDLPGVRKSDMKPEEIYGALDVFFQRYPAETLLQKYKLTNPTFQAVVGAEMIDDQSIEMPSSLLGETWDAVHGKATEAKNAAASAVSHVTGDKVKEEAKGAGESVGNFAKGAMIGITSGVGGVLSGVYRGAKDSGKIIYEGGKEVTGDVSEASKEMLAYAKALYKKNFGKEGSDEEILEWSKQSLKRDESKSGDIDKYVHENIQDRMKADHYMDAMRKGTPEKVDDVDVKYLEFDKGTSHGAIYVESSCKIPGGALGANADQHTVDALKKADTGAREFLKRRYPALKDMMDNHAEFNLGVVVVNDDSYKVYMRMALEGSDEFNQRKNGRWTADKFKTQTNKEKFNEATKFDYDKLEDWEKYNLRRRLMMDDTQRTELKAAIDKYNRIYETKGLTVEVARKRLTENDDDMNEVVTALANSTKYRQNLATNRATLDGSLSDIESLESKAAAKLNASNDLRYQFQIEQQRNMGALVRLALLGDTEASRMLKYGSQFKTAQDLLKQYETDLDNWVKKKNGAA